MMLHWLVATLHLLALPLGLGSIVVRARAFAASRERSVSLIERKHSITSVLSCAITISSFGRKISASPGQSSEMIGVPHAAASNSRTLGEYPAARMSARVRFKVKRCDA